MKKMLKYADDRGRVYYTTSQTIFTRYTKANDSIKTVVFQGDITLTKKQIQTLEKLANGVYTKEN